MDKKFFWFSIFFGLTSLIQSIALLSMDARLKAAEATAEGALKMSVDAIFLARQPMADPGPTEGNNCHPSKPLSSGSDEWKGWNK